MNFMDLIQLLQQQGVLGNENPYSPQASNNIAGMRKTMSPGNSAFGYMQGNIGGPRADMNMGMQPRHTAMPIQNPVMSSPRSPMMSNPAIGMDRNNPIQHPAMPTVPEGYPGGDRSYRQGSIYYNGMTGKPMGHYDNNNKLVLDGLKMGSQPYAPSASPINKPAMPTMKPNTISTGSSFRSAF